MLSYGHQCIMLSWLLMLTWIRPSYSHALYAYNLNGSIQVGAQDPATGKIYYSKCNGVLGTPVFPLDKPNVLDVKEAPKNGTALAAAGWYNITEGYTSASIFWQSTDDAIINGRYRCDPETGKLVRRGEYRISETAGIESIHNNSGLAVERLGNTGYRLFYHNEKRNIMMMRYHLETNWVDGGTVYQGVAAGMAIGSMQFDLDNITVAFPQGKRDIWTSRLEEDGQWRLRGLATPLGNNFTNNSRTIEPEGPASTSLSKLAWNTSLEAMGSSVDHFMTMGRSRRHSIFYIGTDRTLYEVIVLEKSWSIQWDKHGDIGPAADNPSSGIAVAYSEAESKVWVYYWANKTIVQAYRSAGATWADPVALLEQDPNPPEQNESSGLSTGAKVGIGVGVGVGALVAGVLGWLWLKRRNKRKGSGGSPANSHSTEAKKDPAEIDGHERPAELDSHRRPAEMDGHGKPAELADRPSVVHELEG